MLGFFLAPFGDGLDRSRFFFAVAKFDHVLIDRLDLSGLRLAEFVYESATVRQFLLREVDRVHRVAQRSGQRETRRLRGGAAHLLKLQDIRLELGKLPAQHDIPDVKFEARIVGLDQFAAGNSLAQFFGEFAFGDPRMLAVPQIDFGVLIERPTHTKCLSKFVHSVSSLPDFWQIDTATSLKV